MIKTFYKVLGLLLVALFTFSGCEEKTVVTDVEVAQKEPQAKKDTKSSAKEEKKQISFNPQIDISDILQDNAKITANGKYGLFIFESASCQYSNKLRGDIVSSEDIKKRLKEDYSTYSFLITDNKMHSLEHQGEYTKVDTKTMMDIYGVEATPTLIFTDKGTKSIFVVPGYMPPEQFKVTLDFIESARWSGLDRKNGDIYKELKKYYIEKGIIKQKK